MPTDGAQPLSALQGLLTSKKEDLDKCMAVIEHNETVEGVTAKTRLHYLKFDGNGMPMIGTLAELMYKRIIDYCTEARTRPALLDASQAAAYTKRARKLFVHPAATEDDPDRTGEAGELLLFLLIETLLNAPQVVAKMELKTNPNLEVNGSDGIHMAWSETDHIVDVYFGEAKIYQDMGAAIKSALASIDAFHEEDIWKHELLLVTQQFKYAEPAVKQAVVSLLEDGSRAEGLRFNHACLIGYNWGEYRKLFKLPADERHQTFKSMYEIDASRIHGLLNGKLAAFKTKTIRLDIFFLPFENVQDFRDAFNKALD